MWNKRLILIAMAFQAVSCTMAPEVNDDPKRRLNDYISKSFAVKGPEDREQLLSFLSGQAKTRLTAWSDDQFKQAFVDSKREFLKLVFTEEKRVSPSEISIAYVLTYVDQGRGHDAKVTNHKLSHMILDHGHWYIKDVTNIKELVEYRNEMTFPY